MVIYLWLLLCKYMITSGVWWQDASMDSISGYCWIDTDTAVDSKKVLIREPLLSWDALDLRLQRALFHLDQSERLNEFLLLGV
jgi:hypothetical protein